MRRKQLVKKVTPAIDPALIRSKSRILIVDDDRFAYKQLFERDGYRFEQWTQVKSLSPLQDGTFDLIVLDFHGIAPKAAPSEGGLAVLRVVKEARPEQLVLAYSGQQIGLQSAEFISLADDVVSKSEDYPVFKSKVDGLLSRRYSVGYYLAEMNNVLAADVVHVPAFVRRAISAIAKRDSKGLRHYLERAEIDAAKIDRILSLASIATTVIFSL